MREFRYLYYEDPSIRYIKKHTDVVDNNIIVLKPMDVRRVYAIQKSLRADGYPTTIVAIKDL